MQSKVPVDCGLNELKKKALLDRGIYFAKYYGGGGGEWLLRKKMKTEGVGKRKKKKGKGEKEKKGSKRIFKG